MKSTVLRRSGVELSALGFGMGGKWETGTDDCHLDLLRAAFECGIRTFDTAESYDGGRSEEVLGAALKHSRRQCTISTKAHRKWERPDEVLRAAEGSLRRLQTDYIDLYFVHWPGERVPVRQTLSAFRRLKEERVIRAIGVSNFSLAELREAVDFLGGLDAVQFRYNLLERGIERELLPFCAEHAIGVMGYSPTERGLLSGAEAGPHRRVPPVLLRRPWFRPEHAAKAAGLIEALRELAAKKGVAASQIAIGWLLRQRGVTSVLIGTKSKEHLLDNVRAADLEWTAEELQTLDHISRETARAFGE